MKSGKQRQQTFQLPSPFPIFRFTPDISPATVLVSISLVSLHVIVSPFCKAMSGAGGWIFSQRPHLEPLCYQHLTHKPNTTGLLFFPKMTLCGLLYNCTKYCPENSSEILYQSSLSYVTT